LQWEVNKSLEGLQVWFSRQDALTRFSILYNRDNHTDRLCRALWDLLVK